MAIGVNQLGGGSFSGRALYDDNVFTGIHEDVSDIISMVSPFETPLLNELGDAEKPAYNVLYEWLEDQLGPNSLVVTNPTTPGAAILPADTSLTCTNNLHKYLLVGSILKVSTSEEYVQITATSPTTFTVSRGYGGSSAATIATATEFTVVSDAAVEGADVIDDTSRSRTRHSNQCQIFKKDIIVSGSMQAVRHIGVNNEFDYQLQMRTREALRDLEKAVILSIISDPATAVGASNATRTMRGLRQSISTNATTVTTIDNANIVTIMQAAWDNGGSDLDLLICGRDVKKRIDLLNETGNASRIVSEQGDNIHRRVVTEYEGTFGRLTTLLSRWMPPKEGIIIARNRVRVVPLVGRSFHYEPVAKTGDADKGMVVGEYTCEVRNEYAMCRFYFNG